MLTAEVQQDSWYPHTHNLLKRPHYSGIAIDPPNPEEIDDAIAVTRLDKTSHLVRVHIADGGLLYGTPYVDLAREEGWSRYHSTYGTAPMLPHTITKETLGLDAPAPHGVPAVSISFVHDAQTGIGDVAIEKSRVHVLGTTYKQFKTAFYDRDPAAITMKQVAHHVHPAGKVETFSPDQLGEEVVMQYMVAANFLVARSMEAKGLPWLFRNHTNAAYERWENEKERETLQRLRTALYGGIALRHEGLGIEQYCHFTSPLRRFADLANHLTLHADMYRLPLPYDESDIDSIALELTAKYIERSRHFRAV